jgi:hypothetical protein
MLKFLPIFAALALLGAGSAHAQQREAVLQKIEVPNASFDLLIAMPRPGSPAVIARNQPDPNVIYLGNDLVTAYTAELAKTLDVAVLLSPAKSVVGGRGNHKDDGAVVYVIPKSATSTSAAMR